LGSVRQLVNEAGEVSLVQSYQPYGTVLGSAGDGLTSYGFTGEWTDSNTDLVYLRARWYSNRLNEIVRGRRGISGDTALRLGRATNTTPEFWLNLQALYDLEIAKDELGDRLEQEVTPVMISTEDHDQASGLAAPSR